MWIGVTARSSTVSALTALELALQAKVRELRDRIAELEKQQESTQEEHRRIADSLERQKAEASLQGQPEWSRVTLASIGDAVLATDEAGRITFFNPAAAQLTGWTEEEAVGRAAKEVFRVMNEKTRDSVE